MPAFRTALLALALCAPPAVSAEVPALFERHDQGADMLLHTRELRELDRVSFSLPTGDLELDLRMFQDRGAASYTLIGSVPGMPMLHAMITVEGNGVSGLVTHPDLGTHVFKHADPVGGVAKVVVPPAIPECGCDCSTHDAATKRPQSALDRPLANTHAAIATTTSAISPAAHLRGFELCRDSLVQIDVLVLYSQSALTQAGSVATLEAEIQMGIDEFNLSCSNSTPFGIVPSARLVHVAMADQPQSTSNSGSLLGRLQTIGDGNIEEAHTLRDEHKADMVLYVAGSLDVCGRAFISVLPGNTPRPDLAFGVVNYSCITAPVYAMAHEMGHILGALHDFEDDYCDTGSQVYSHGFVAPDAAFRTIMATSNPDAPRIPYFSESDVSFMGQPVGNGALGRNGFAFRVGAATAVARYRLSDCNGGNFCDDREIELGMVDDLDGNGVPDECQPDEDANGVIDNLEIMNNASLDIDGDGMLDSVEQPVRYVDKDATGLGTGLSWADAHTSIHVALDAVERSGGDITEVWVASGVYKPSPNTEQRAAAYAPPSNVTMYGGFAGTETDPAQRDLDANPTILSGDLVGQDSPEFFAGHRDNSLTILRISSVTGVVIDGFTFNGGYGNTKSNCGFFNYGGAVSSFKSGYTLRRCVFTRCGANNGGAIGSIENSIPRIYDCEFVGNTMVPVDFKTVTGDIVTRTGIAAGVYMSNSPDPINNAIISGCRFTGNTVGSSLSLLGGEPIVANSVFTDNTIDESSTLSMASTQGSDATIINCVVANNNATTNLAGVGIGNFRGDVEIINTIVYGNRGSGTLNVNTQANTNGGGTTLIRNSLLELATPTHFDTTYVNVQDLDPQFTDAMNGDYSLSATSPAIDAGDTSALDGLGITTDLIGNDRFADDPAIADTGIMSVTDPGRPIVDLGAIERQIENSCVTDFNNDGVVDIIDFGVFGTAFGSMTGDLNYNSAADVNNDGLVDIIDFGVFGAEFNRTDCL